MNRLTNLGWWAVVHAMGLALKTAGAATIPQDVQTHIRELVDVGGAVGMVVGMVDESGETYFSHGVRRVGEADRVDEKSIFEIGSITKVLTSIALAVAVFGDMLDPNDPVALLLPGAIKLPQRSGKTITLMHLASHRSGLPRLPDNLNPNNPANPYAGYTREQLYEFLERHELTRDPGSAYEYSNMGAGLLGLALSRSADKNYEHLIVERVCQPLALEDTRIFLFSAQRARLAAGHADGMPVPNWDFDALAGAGAFRSTAKDMVRFLAANVGLENREYWPILQRSQAERFPTPIPDTQVAMGWHVTKRYGNELFWHNGGTGGYRSFCGFDPARKLGVVVLTNSTEEIDEVGFHLLDTQYTLKPVRKPRPVPIETLKELVGRYEMAPGVEFDVSLEGDQLFARLTGQNRFAVFAESDMKFFYKVVDAQLTFVRDAEGKVHSLILHQNGRDQPAKKK